MRPRLLWSLGATLVVLSTVGTLLHRPDEVEIGSWERLVAWIGLALAAGAAYLAACAIAVRNVPDGDGALSRRGSLALVLLVAVGMRLCPLIDAPSLSSDIYRYVWDGRVQMAGINPYLHIPADPALAHLRDPDPWPRGVYSNINRRETAKTIYPPAAQGLFLLAAAAWPGVQTVKLLIVLLEAAAIAIAAWLLRLAGQPPARVLLYAWAPLPAWKFAGNGHIDGAALGFLALALLAAAYRRDAAAGLMLGAAALCKFLPLAVLPALWRPFAGQGWQVRLPLALAAAVAAGYACYLGAGCGVLGFLGGYGEEEGLSSGAGILWLRLLGTVLPLPGWAGKAYLLLALGLLALLALWVARTPLSEAPGARGMALARGTLLLAAALMASVTPHYAWYLCWLPWLACFCPVPSIFFLIALAPLLYLDGGHDRVLWPTLVFVPPALLAAVLPLCAFRKLIST